MLAGICPWSASGTVVAAAMTLNFLFFQQASGMNVVVKTGSTSVLLRDALRRPLAELELGGVKAGLRKLPKGVMQVSPCCLLHH